LEGREHLGDLSLDGRIILKLDHEEIASVNSCGSGEVRVVSLCENGIELSGFIKSGEFLENDCWLLKKDFTH
jgi:hypothetical protein